MKNLYKNILSVSLLMCFVLSAVAQVTQIFVPENNPKSNVKPKIIIEDNQLFAITSSGVYSQHLDNSGNLTAKTLLPCEFFTSFDYEVQDLAVKGDTIYVATTNYFQDKNAILASYDRGETWIDLDTWEGLGEFYNHQPAIRRGEIGNTNEIIAITMTHKLLILITALVLAGCVGKTRTNNTHNTEPTANESSIAADSMYVNPAVIQNWMRSGLHRL